MHKFLNRNFIMKLTMIFLVLQPIFDIKFFYDFEIFGVTIPTIIRLLMVGILFLLFMFSKKQFKFPILYVILFTIYTFLHLFNASHNYINSLTNLSIISEIIYLIRLAIPMMFILFSYHYNFEFKTVSKLFFTIALIFSSIIIVTNLLGIAYPSYTYSKEISGSFLNWPFLSKTDIGYFNLATKGLFGYANPLSGLMCLILPILLYSFYKKCNLKKFVIIYSVLISMLILGTRISSYMTIILLLVMLIVYIVLCKLFKTEIFNSKCLFYNIALIVLIIPFFMYAPITFASDRGMPEDHKKYVLKNELLDKVSNYRKSLNEELDEDSRQRISNFIKKDFKYFSVEKGLAPDKYLYDDYLEFWLDYFIVSYKNQNDTRDFELYLFNHIYKQNHNIYDNFVGYGYSQTFNNGSVLERDGIYHFYTLGIWGLILFVAPYYVILIYAIYKVLRDFKHKINLKNVTYIFVVALLLLLAMIGGNIFDFFLVNIFLSFICGQLLYNVRNDNVENIGGNNA